MFGYDAEVAPEVAPGSQGHLSSTSSFVTWSSGDQVTNEDLRK